jgi:hypothetical protein
VAGSLDRTVDARAIFRIEPAVAGAVEWRDPITIRFRPTALLEPGVTYTVTVANSFAAMDGSRLARPHEFSFLVRGPRVLTGSPAFQHRHPTFLGPRPTFELVVATPVDLPRVARAVSLGSIRDAAPNGRCRRAVEQRPIRTDLWEYKVLGPRPFPTCGGSWCCARTTAARLHRQSLRRHRARCDRLRALAVRHRPAAGDGRVPGSWCPADPRSSVSARRSAAPVLRHVKRRSPCGDGREPQLVLEVGLGRVIRRGGEHGPA